MSHFRDVFRPEDELGKPHNLLSINAFKVQGVDFEFNASTSLDHPCQFPKRRLRERSRTPNGRREVVMVVIALVLIGGISRGTGLPCPIIREGPPGGIRLVRDITPPQLLTTRT